MKVLRILLIVVLILFLTIIIGGFIFLKTFNINRYKPQIIAAASHAIGRDIELGPIDYKVSIKDGVRLRVNDVLVKEAAEYGGGDFMKVKEVFIGIDIVSLVLRQKIFISDVDILSPEITIIRTNNGRFNFETLKPATESSVQSNSKSKPPAAAATIPFVYIKSIRLDSGIITYIDQSLDPSLQMQIKQMNLKVNDFSLTAPFAFVLQAALLKDNPNLMIEGSGRFDLAHQGVQLSKTKIAIELESISQIVSQLKPAFPILKYIPFPEVLEGKLDTTINVLSFNQKGLSDVSVDIQLDNAKIKFPNVMPGVSFDASSIDLIVKNLGIKGDPFEVNLKMAYLGDEPNVSFAGTVGLDLAKQNISLKNSKVGINFSNFSLEQLKTSVVFLSQMPFPKTLEGQLDATLDEFSAGAKGIENLKVDVRFSDGKIDLMNILPEYPILVSKIQLDAQDITLDGNLFPLKLQMAYLKDQPNISLDGSVGFNLGEQKISAKEMKIETNLASLPFAELKASLPQLKDVPIPEVLEGNLKLNLQELTADSKGLKDMVIDILLSDGKIGMAQAAPGISFEASKIGLDVQDFGLKGNPFELKLDMAYLGEDQNIFIDGTGVLDLSKLALELINTKFSTDLNKISLEKLKSSVEVLQKTPFPSVLGGTLQGMIKGLTVGAAGVSNVLLDAQWQGGVFEFLDAASGTQIKASQIGLDLKRFSTNFNPFEFNLSAAYLSAQPNVFIVGTGMFDIKTQQFDFSNTKISTDLSTISFEELKASMPAMKDVSLPESLKGKVEFTVDQIKGSPSGLTALISHGEIIDGFARIKELALPIDSIVLKFNSNATKLTVEDLSLAIGKGRLKGSAIVESFLTRQAFTANLDVVNFDLAEIIDQSKQPVKMEGSVFSKFNVSGVGLDPAKLMASLTGDGNLEIKNGKILDMNILQLVISKLSMIPNVEERINASLPEEYKAKLNQKDTILEKVGFIANIQGGQMMLNPIDVNADGFLFQGTGQVGFDQSYSIAGSFIIPEDLATSMVAGVGEFQYLLDEGRMIRFPLTVSGKGADVSFKPDLEFLGTRIIKNKGKEELQKVLNKVLNIPSEEQTITENPDAQNPSQPQPEKKPEEQLIEGLLDSIFK